jgi:D-psicose/D-tagatose/L-ribulose 3-epimerase
LKYSVTLSSFTQICEPLNNTLRILNELGYDGVECVGEGSSVSHSKGFKEVLLTYGLEVSGVTGMWGKSSNEASERRLLSLDADKVKHAESYVGQCLQLCRLLEGHEFNVCLFSDSCFQIPDFSHQILSSEEKFKLISRSLPVLRKLAERAKDNNVMLLIEPLNRYTTPYCSTAADALSICKMVDHPNLGILLDTFHMNIEEASFSGAINSAKDFLFHMHFADNNRMMPGWAHIDFDSVMMALNENKYNRYISFEPNLEENSYLDSLREGISYIKKKDFSQVESRK